ncbi:N-acetyltransferase [Clostridia bacterium]|nr:N-acetyltransferase [Clostridia bacterium]
MTKIKKWQAEDASALAKAINNKAVLDNLRDGIPFPHSEKDSAEYIEAMTSADPNNTFAFAITLNDEVIGSIGAFRGVNIHNRTAEIGYYIAQEHWGKGITTQAVRLLCDYIFENTNIIRLYAEPFAHNIASCKVLEKAGFTYEGTLHSNAVKNGKVIDMKMYSFTIDN